MTTEHKEAEMSDNIPDGEEFARALKALLLKHNVGVFRCQFQLMIEDHSLTWLREFNFENVKINSNKIERSELTIVGKKQI